MCFPPPKTVRIYILGKGPDAELGGRDTERVGVCACTACFSAACGGVLVLPALGVTVVILSY